MLTLEKLRAFGANVDEGMQRCINNESFYLMLTEKAIRDPGFEKLLEAAENGDLDRGFELSHALKGVTANLALTPLFAPIAELTELFRNKADADYVSLVKAILAKRDELTASAGENKPQSVIQSLRGTAYDPNQTSFRSVRPSFVWFVPDILSGDPKCDGHDRIADGDPRLLLTKPTAGWYLSPDGSAILYRPKTEPERLMSQTMP